MDYKVAQAYFLICIEGAQLAQMVECQTLDRKVAGSYLNRGVVLCP